MFTRLPRVALATLLVGGIVATLALAGCRRQAAEPIRVVDAPEVLSPAEMASIDDHLRWVAAERGIDYRVVVMAAGEVSTRCRRLRRRGLRAR